MQDTSDLVLKRPQQRLDARIRTAPTPKSQHAYDPALMAEPMAMTFQCAKLLGTFQKATKLRRQSVARAG